MTGSEMAENDTTEYVVAVVPAISEIGRNDWDRCLEVSLTTADARGASTNDGKSSEPGPIHVKEADANAGVIHPVNPFVTYDFLNALETTGCISASTGWFPQHLVLRGKGDDALAVMPAYLKSHSMGEYVFDHGWAQAFEAAGGDYYPKLQCAVPFTPVTGPRVLVRPGVDQVTAIKAMASATAQLTDRIGASSAHVTFLNQDQWQVFGAAGFLKRTDRQFHWHNADYVSFDDFLAVLTSRKRKDIRKERARALAGDIEIEWLTGDQIKPHHWDSFYQFYLDTGMRKWGEPYLNHEAFTAFGEKMADHILLVMAKQQDRYIAGALNFIGADTLYGRYWGCLETHDFLHFEVCYYQAMEYAIKAGLKTVEAGAQGEHKLMRGYMPETTYSAHYIRHPGLAHAIEAYLDEERRHGALEREVLADHGPFRKGPTKT